MAEANFPCHGCWWGENHRCYNDNLGLGEAPRDAPIFSGKNGFEQTDAHLSVCASVHGREDRRACVGSFQKSLRRAGLQSKGASQ